MEKRFLLIDQGNSRIKYRLTNQKGVVIEEKNILNPLFTIDRLSNFPSPDYVLLLNSGELLFNPSEVWPGAIVHFFSAELTEGIEWAYPDVRQLGTDRMAALMGAQIKFPGKNLILAVAGTCLTIDYLQKDGKHLGGYISPGIRMRLQAMHHFTHRLPLPPDNFIFSADPGKSTNECMQSGAFMGLLGELEHHFRQDFFNGSEADNYILSGGDAEDLAHHLKQSTFVATDLVFLGMFRVCQRIYNAGPAIDF